MTKSNTTKYEVTSYNCDTGELVCCAPGGEIVLEIIIQDFKIANEISEAIQKAYRKGMTLGRLNMQLSIEQHMDKINQTVKL